MALFHKDPNLTLSHLIHVSIRFMVNAKNSFPNYPENPLFRKKPVFRTFPATTFSILIDYIDALAQITGCTHLQQSPGKRKNYRQSLQSQTKTCSGKSGRCPVSKPPLWRCSKKTQTVQAVGKSRGLFPRGAGQHLRFGFLF